REVQVACLAAEAIVVEASGTSVAIALVAVDDDPSSATLTEQFAAALLGRDIRKVSDVPTPPLLERSEVTCGNRDARSLESIPRHSRRDGDELFNGEAVGWIEQAVPLHVGISGFSGRISPVLCRVDRRGEHAGCDEPAITDLTQEIGPITVSNS
ncbi:MAG: hypothetical protein ABJ382_01860, partial [Ilumatobacter sp.]